MIPWRTVTGELWARQAPRDRRQGCADRTDGADNLDAGGMADGWTADVIARFEEALAQVAADNGQALRLAMYLHQTATLEEKQRTLEAWRLLAAHTVIGDVMTAAPKELPSWFGVAELFDDWTRREGAPLPPVVQLENPLGK